MPEPKSSLLLRLRAHSKYWRPQIIQYEDDRGFDVGSFWLLRRRGYRRVPSGTDVMFEAGGDR